MTKKSPAARFANIRDESSHEYPVPEETVAAGPTPLVPAKGTEESEPRRQRAKTEARGNRSGAQPRARRESTVVRPPSRVGKVGMQLWVDSETRKKLKHYATEQERSLDDVLGEAVTEFIRKHV